MTVIYRSWQLTTHERVLPMYQTRKFAPACSEVKLIPENDCPVWLWNALVVHLIITRYCAYSVNLATGKRLRSLIRFLHNCFAQKTCFRIILQCIRPATAIYNFWIATSIRSKKWPVPIAGQNLHARLCNHKNLYISLMNKDRLDYADGMQAKLILPNCH